MPGLLLGGDYFQVSLEVQCVNPVHKIYITVFICIFNFILAINGLIDAQCTGVQLLVDDQPFTATTLYKPVGSSGTFVSCMCTTGERRPNWLDPNGMKVILCKDDKERSSEYCADNPDRMTRSLTFTSFMQSQEGNYTCMGENVNKSLTIAILG